MNIFYYSGGLDPSNPTGLRYDGSLYQGSPGLCSPASANTLVSSAPVIAAGPYGPPSAPGGRAMDLVVAPSTVLSMLAPQIQSRNFCAGSAYRMKTPYMLWPKLFRSRDRVDKSVRCEPCDMVLNSEQQARQHFNGKHHLRRMRKMKINSSDDKCTEDLKRNCAKTDTTGKKTRQKKHNGPRNDEDAVQSTADVSSNGGPAADEETVSIDEESAKSPRPRDKADAAHLFRLENSDWSEDVPMSAIIGRLKNTDSAEEPTPASFDDFSRSRNKHPCSNSSHANCAVVHSDRQAADCPSPSYVTPNHLCPLLQDSGVYVPSASCYSSPLIQDVLCQSSLQSSHVMSSVSSNFEMVSSRSTTTSKDNDILSVAATSFVPGSLLPRS